MSALPHAATPRARRSIVPGEFTLTTADFRQIADILHGETGIWLSDAKATLVYSRLRKRIAALGMNTFADYCDLITSKNGDGERGNMINALTTNTTRFYREAHHFDILKAQIMPQLIAAARKGERIRLWSAACSSGEEPYSIALTLLSALPDAASLDVKILATDIDRNVLAKASKGVYSDADLEPVPETQKRKYFTKAERSACEWQATDELRSLISFKQLNLIKPWPMKGKFDIVFCRNVVIYFADDTQRDLWSRFQSILQPGGWLFIGHSERISGPATMAFSNEGKTAYQKSQNAREAG